jgi:1-acyl-sn-glycerol-3-phosphate acyltransferase
VDHSAHREAKPPRRPENRPFVRLLQAVDVCYARIYHQVLVTRPHHLPREGAGILIANHISALDPLLIQSVLPRLITWMMAKEYFGNPILDRIFHAVGIIPVERSGKDLASTRAALRALHEGRMLGIFPEGKLSPTGQLLPFQSGAALMAIKTGVPVYPVYLHGSQLGQGMLEVFLRRNRCEIVFGDPLRFPKTESVESANDRIRQALLDLQSHQRYKISPKKSKFPLHAPGG